MKTSVFSLRKQKWFHGPNLPEEILTTYGTAAMYCVTSLNRTSTIFIGVNGTMKGVISYDFASNIWTQMANIPVNIMWCSCSSNQEKNYNQ